MRCKHLLVIRELSALLRRVHNTTQGLRTLRCVRLCATQRKLASSEIDAKNATQRFSVAQLNLDLPVDSTHKFSEAWKTSAFEWGVLYSLLWLLGGGVGEEQYIGRRGYALSLPSEYNRASTTILCKKCASLIRTRIFATSECRRRDSSAC